MKKNYGILVGIIVCVIVAGVFAVYAYQKQNHSKKAAPSSTSTAQIPKIQTTEVPKGQMPLNFPADFPSGNQMVVYQNTQTLLNGSYHESAMQFASSLSADANYALYTAYFQKNNWILGTTVNQSAVKTISAQKGSLQAIITISENATSKAVIVNTVITY